jgi:hypothetical protein
MAAVKASILSEGNETIPFGFGGDHHNHIGDMAS